MRRIVASGPVPDPSRLEPTVCLLSWRSPRGAVESVAIAYVCLRARDGLAHRLMSRSDCEWWIDPRTSLLRELRDSPNRRRIEADLTRYRAVLAG